MSTPELNVTEVFTGKRLLFSGSTGFVGKVTLSMLLSRYGEQLDKLYVLVRKGSAPSAERRFFDKVATSEPFQPLRDAHGDEGALEFLRRKVEVLDGDITDPLMGLTPEQADALVGQVHAIINCAGLVSFNPSLEVGLNVNTHGVKNTVELALKWKVPLVHMSTAFVAGNRNGLVFEDEDVVGYFPRQDELDGRDFSLEQELADADKVVARLREQADDKTLTSLFRKKALERLEQEGRDATDEKTLRLAVGRERKLWLSGELVRAGMDRARHWGWPNTYTYTKSLGEQVMASTPGLRYAIVRPSIVESAQHFPFPGWNEGFTTSAPLAFAGIKGQRNIPAGDKAILDIIPVDHVAGATIGITAHSMKVEERRVYHLSSGDVNPFYASRSIELVGLYRRRYYRNKETGSALMNELRSRIEPMPASRFVFENFSAPMFVKGARLLRQAIDEVKPAWGAPKVQAVMERAREALTEVEEQGEGLMGLIDLFMPFLYDNRYVFRCDNTRSVYAHMAPHDRARIPWAPEAIDWRVYFLDTHLPGLEKWVFPGLEEETKRRTVIPAHRDLLEMLEASVNAWRHRVAFRFAANEKEERFTYGEVNRYANRVGSFLLKEGVKRNERVMLLSENRPEWPISYFGILRAGGTAVPVDSSLNESEVVNIARRSEARVLLLSEETAAEMPNLAELLAQAGVSTRVVSLAEAMSGDPQYPDSIGPVRRTAAADDVASLIFTSGTTGTPKGVMLTHRNFASLIAKLAGAFAIGVGDGVLSVLPLHHTFEFSAGFLTPFSRGAEVTYIDELTSDKLGEVFETGRVSAMIGVPALWQLLHRKVTQEMASRPPLVEQAIKTLMATHGELRNRSSLNLGKLLFWPVHRKFGGKIKFLVSGGSALPDDVHKAFHQLGFNIIEGYGLTEAAPVLTVSETNVNKRLPGTVGKALPGIELRILEPDNEGIGEVIARGPSVMAGYFGDKESTDAVLKEGWLYTGDLGRIDAEGRLYLVGRKKDVIIDANGKNVYPDELEEVYGDHAHIKELSIVGLPDEAGGEKVACLCVPDYLERPREEVRRELEEHFRKKGHEMPFYRRVKVLRFTDMELPRTSSRKVKRKQVVEEFKKLDRLVASGDKARERVQHAGTGGVADWLYPLLAEVVNRPLADIRPEAHLSGDLGVDSLMLTELSVALEQAGVPLPSANDLTHVQTVEDLRKLVLASGRKPSAETRAKDISRETAKSEEVEIPVPEPLVTLGRQVVRLGQQAIFGGLFDVKVTGKPFIPQNRNFLVIANHTSHLDMGLVKLVLGEQGQRLTTIAARDYFFDTPLKRAYFENFTDLIPMDRHGSLRESLRMAGSALQQGYNLLIFPEGTRSVTGELLEFKPTLGYLSLTYNVDVLPIYLKGAYEALPKGRILPKSRELEGHIGPVLTHEMLRAKTHGMSRSESYRYATRLAEDAIRALAAGRVLSFDDSATVEDQRRALSTGRSES
ncbi:Long-chain-fatty-acid--CoA ligase [Cystobacter fuscus DSM 2262]|uniref:Long-chain-fatty-acid--CoA ligase n=1 Tax=Cystobacter fuscus (strain ATCC 25194 / DSM 2262 / NBRC 100088 / M29) TaxID=1242864 RepID=S9PF55_CYSF2|nr:AMP-binding protein [Cystobacter fuscus]EPX61656.1 Long-chain-fatty-acid--CoA ligase [Cystobacter fuscus DSM 2262]